MLIQQTTAVSADMDHLVPVDTKRHRTYRKIFTSKLGLTPFDYGRIIFLPSFEGESSLSIYCSAHKSARPNICFITSVRARDNLWQLTDAGREAAKAQSAKVHRVDAEIPQETAALVKEAWQKMLANVKERESLRSDEETIPIDGTSIEFSIERSNTSGEVNLWLPTQGKKVKTFIELTHFLTDYCQAKSIDRSSIAKRINRKANELLALIKYKGNQ